MKKAWKNLIEVIKNEDYTTREAVLSGLVLFLLGILLGLFFSPKKSTMIGSNNGNNNKGSLGGDDAEDSEEENKKGKEK